MADPVVSIKYQSLWGRKFYAAYQGVFYVPQTGTSPIARDVLSIVEEYPFTSTLREVSNDVLTQPYSQQVWKAITGPDDTPGQNDFRLWVEPGLSEVVPLHTPRRFKVDACAPFRIDGVPFSHGVNIKVSALPFA